MKIIWITFDGNGFSIAKKLQDEGHEVLVGQAESYQELDIDKEEDPKDQKMRLSTWDGMIEKTSAAALLAKAKDFEDKDSWGVVCDFNNLFRYAELFVEAGFAGENGTGFYLLPTREQYDLESDRAKGKTFVEEHYQGLQVGEKHDFKTIDEGIQFLEQGSESLWVLKAYNDDINAVVPTSEDPMLAKDELISALAAERAGYEAQGYLLEEKISQPQEFTPQAVFYNGEPVFYDIDVETKPIFAGDTGPQTGCATNLVFPISEFDPIIDLAFPPVVYDMAIKQKGLFVWDASVLVDQRTGKKYFGEFCANRWGFDSFFTEISMCGSATDYFEKVMRGENPIMKPYGASVRMFNVKKNAGVSVIHKNTRDIWMYDVKKEKKNVVSIGYCWDLCVATGAGDDLDEAVENCYETMQGIAFTGGGYKPKFDFLSEEYPTSLISRHNAGVGQLYSGTKYEGIGIDERVRRLEKSIERMKKDGEAQKLSYDLEVNRLKDQVIDALHEEES